VVAPTAVPFGAQTELEKAQVGKSDPEMDDWGYPYHTILGNLQLGDSFDSNGILMRYIEAM
jgi:hypothetical protein